MANEDANKDNAAAGGTPTPDAPKAPEGTAAGESNHAPFDPSRLDILNDVAIALTIEIGRTQIKIRDLLSLTKGSVVELNKLAGDPVDVYANGRLISRGNIITANGKYCVRLTSISDKGEMTKGEEKADAPKADAKTDQPAEKTEK